MPRKKTKNLDKISQIHGKEEKFQPTTLEQIWGSDGNDKYFTTNQAEYEEWIQSATKSDLFKHATKVGFVPTDNVGMLRKKLLQEFKKVMSTYKFPSEKKKKNPNLSKKALDILKEGS